LTRPLAVCLNGAVSLRRALAMMLLLPLAAACDGLAPSGGAPPGASSAAAKASPVEVTLIGTSDLHGRLATLPALGGYVSALRAKNPDGVVLVDAGDMFQGTLESNSNEGEAVIEAYKKLGYDAVAIGNHEFDYGPVGEASTVRKNATAGPDSDPRGALKARAAQARGAFPMLAANLVEEGHPLSWPNVTASTLVTKNGVRVGIVGVTTMGTLTTTISANVTGMRVTPLAEAIAEQARALREKGARLVIVAAHAGGNCTRTDAPADLSSCEAAAEIFDVARKLPAGAVQAIVAGHTHKSIAHEVAGIAILQSDSYGTAFGRVDFTVDAATGKVLATKIHSPEKVSRGGLFEGAATVPAGTVEAAIAPAVESARGRRAESLGVTLSAPFPAKYRDESALGNLVTGLLLELDPKVDIAIANGGGMRADLPAGPLTYGAFYDTLPFDNRLARVTMTGRMLRDTFERNLTGKSGILSIAGARVTAACEAGKLALEIVLTGRSKAERKVKDDDHVVVLTNEFLATRGDDFGAPGEQVEIDEDGPPLREPLAALLKKQGGALKPEEWLIPGKPRVRLPGPIGSAICEH
jgi:2',3'-cyclic-nucleotide 2'-phosphodiesterase (5'-nucleotidase family)